MKHKIDDKLSFKWFLAVTFPIIIILPEDCSEFRELSTNKCMQIARQLRCDFSKQFLKNDFCKQCLAMRL